MVSSWATVSGYAWLVFIVWSCFLGVMVCLLVSVGCLLVCDVWSLYVVWLLSIEAVRLHAAATLARSVLI